MEILAYTKDKTIVKVDLAVDVIADAWIDPWRLDLFDTDPVILGHGDDRLYFRRLQDTAFAYFDAKRWVVCLIDGTNRIAVTGDVDDDRQQVTDDGVLLRNTRGAAGTFAHHLETLASIMQAGSVGAPYFEMHVADFEADEAASVRSASALQMQGSTTMFDFSDALHEHRLHTFTGRMFEPVAYSTTLPDKVNFIINEAAEGTPIVYGFNLTETAAGTMLRDVPGALAYEDTVQLIVNKSSWKSLSGRLKSKYRVKQEYDWQLYIEVDGVNYDIRAWKDCSNAAMEKALLKRDPSENERFTPELLYACRPNQLRGFRISFFDIGKMQARYLFREDFAKSGDERESGADNLERLGFAIPTVAAVEAPAFRTIQQPTAACQGAALQRYEPNPLPRENSRPSVSRTLMAA